MTYLGRGRGGGVTSASDNPSPHPPHSIPNMSRSTSASTHCTGGMWGNHTLQSTPLSLPLSEEKEYICPDPAHICLMPLCWQTLFAHTGMLHLAEVGLLNVDWMQRITCTFHWTCHTPQWTWDIATRVIWGLVCLLCRLVTQYTRRRMECWCFLSREHERKLLRVFVRFRGCSSPCGQKRTCCFPSTNNWTQ